MSHRDIENRIKIIRYIHYGVLLLFVLSILLIFLSPAFSIFGALIIVFIGLLQINSKGECPLTVEEHKIRHQIGDTNKEDFTRSVFKHHFGINIPGKIVTSIVWTSFIISSYVVLVYLYLIFKNL